MLYKSKQLITEIYELNNSFRKHFGKSCDKIFIHGSFKKIYFNYITDIDFVFIPKKKNMKELIPNVLKFLIEKKCILLEFNVKKINEEYFAENEMVPADLKKEENILMYRKWKPEEIESGLKKDTMGNLIELGDFTNSSILKHKNYAIVDFIYLTKSGAYIPMSIAFEIKKQKKDVDAVLQEVTDFYEEKNYKKAYSRLYGMSHYILKDYNIEEKESLDLLYEIKKFESITHTSNLISSIANQIEVVGYVRNYQLNIKNLINNLYRIVKDKKIIRRLYYLKKNLGKSYYHNLQELSNILDLVIADNNKFIKPHADRLRKKVLHMLDNFKLVTVKKTKKTSKKPKKISKKIMKNKIGKNKKNITLRKKLDRKNKKTRSKKNKIYSNKLLTEIIF